MGHHERFYLLLEFMPATEEGRKYARLQCLPLSKQVKGVSRVVKEIDNDFMVTSVVYDGTGNSRITGYSVQETRKEMQDRIGETTLGPDNVAHHHVWNGRAGGL